MQMGIEWTRPTKAIEIYIPKSVMSFETSLDNMVTSTMPMFLQRIYYETFWTSQLMVQGPCEPNMEYSYWSKQQAGIYE